MRGKRPTGGLFGSCGWAIYPKGGAICPLFTFFTLDNYIKTDKVIINMMVLIKRYNKKGILYFNIELICTILTKILHFSLKVGFLPLATLRKF